jgi:hypothetical protein
MSGSTPSRRPCRTAVLAAFLVLALFATACSSPRNDSDEAPNALDAVIERLAAADMAVYADAADPEPLVAPAEPVSPMRLWSGRSATSRSRSSTAAA